MAGAFQPQKLWCMGRVKARLQALCSILLRTSLQDLIRQITCYAWCSVLNTFKLVCPRGKWRAKSERITFYTNNSECFISGPPRNEISFPMLHFMFNSIEYQRVCYMLNGISIYRANLTTLLVVLFFSPGKLCGGKKKKEKKKKKKKKLQFLTVCLLF